MPALDFKGKSFIYTHHLGVPYRELLVVPEKSCPVEGRPPDLDDNLILHGDNLEALKALLPCYAGKVDCNHIDPPYTTPAPRAGATTTPSTPRSCASG